MHYTTFYGVDSGNERVRDPLLRIAPVILASAIAAIGWVYKPAQIAIQPTPSGQNSFSQSSQPAATSKQNSTSATTTNTGTGTSTSGSTAIKSSSSTAVGGRGGAGIPVFNTGGSPTK